MARRRKNSPKKKAQADAPPRNDAPNTNGSQAAAHEPLREHLHAPAQGRNGTSVAASAPVAGAEASGLLARILAVLRTRASFDFRCFRKTTLQRRVERRMALCKIETVADYVQRLRNDSAEVQQLARDLFLSVCSFFRDALALETLVTQAIAPLVAAAPANTVLRIWTPGWATGEEAYTIAMLFFEELARARKNCSVQVFATEMDSAALDVARRGVYADRIEADVSPERLARFFVKLDDAGYRVSKQLRESVVFATHKLLADPPYSQLHLICCRNVLMYLEPEAQRRLISMFHFALRPGAYLFLGPLETMGTYPNMFEPVSNVRRIYRRVTPADPGALGPLPVPDWKRPALRPAVVDVTRPASFADVAQRLLLAELAPVAVLINRRREVLYFVGQTNGYLDMPNGAPTQDILVLAREVLRSRLQSAIHAAGHGAGVVHLEGAHVLRDGHYVPVKITVKAAPATGGLAELMLVMFQDVPGGAAQMAPPAPHDEGLVALLENELRATREDLQHTIEELETTKKELKASNEEIMAVNEEMNSACDELRTSNEELQLLNQELNTANAQLLEKIKQAESSNDDMANVLGQADVAVVFLDRSLRIRRFTPAATRYISLIPADVGRPVTDVALRINDPGLFAEADQVLDRLVPSEREVVAEDGQWCSRRLAPYRTNDNRIEGLVLTFTNVTRIKEAAEQADRLAARLEHEVDIRTAAHRASEARLRAILDAPGDAIFTFDRKGIIESINVATGRLFGYKGAELIGTHVKALVHDVHAVVAHYLESGDGSVLGVAREAQARCKDGSYLAVDLVVNEIPHLRLFTAIVRDMSRRKELEREVVDIATMEQQRIGQTLHDECGQELTAVGILTNSLIETLVEQAPDCVDIARKVRNGTQRVLGQLRSIARGLVEAVVEPSGLAEALEDFCQRVSETGIPCRFGWDQKAAVFTAFQATHLYHIAQEACNNACKHARARSIAIELASEKGSVILRIQDDGIGLANVGARGLGLPIMRNRANVIGAQLSVEPAPGGGTVVTCTLREDHLHVRS